MAETTNYQCPACGGTLHFDGQLGQLKCDYCDSTFTTQEIESLYAEAQQKADKTASTASNQGEKGGETARPHVTRPVSNDPVQAYLEYSRLDDEENLRAYNCSSCGAQLMVDKVTAVTTCPYCGNNTVLPGQLSDVLKPDYVIPFKTSKEEAIQALANYYKGKAFLPNTFTSSNHIEEIQGVYVPFWLYTGTASGKVEFAATRVFTHEDSDNIYTETDHYRLYRDGSLSFMRVPVDGSTRMPDTHMDAIEPFDYGELTDFSIAYLPGYVTDRYDLNASECEDRAATRVGNTYTDALRSTCTGYATVTETTSNIGVAWKQVSYALLPVWMLHTKWNGNDYLFAMNGQTGRLIGDLPVDWGKVVLRFLIVFVPLLIAAFLVVTFAFNGYTA